MRKVADALQLHRIPRARRGISHVEALLLVRNLGANLQIHHHRQGEINAVFLHGFKLRRLPLPHRRHLLAMRILNVGIEQVCVSVLSVLRQAHGVAALDNRCRYGG